MRTYDPADIVLTITTEIAEAKTVAIEDLPPLGNIIDIDALEQILQSNDGEVQVSFEYADWTITITGDGRITMSDPGSEQGPYVGRCNTCNEEAQGVDLETAQDFFANHADQRHEVEIVRSDGIAPDQHVGTEAREPGEAPETD